jgi:DNA-binding NtrC family response regulator
VDVRIIAATNQDLAALVRAGRFRNDLFYRLKVVPVRLPPLRERREDIPLLVEHFVKRFRGETGKAIEGASEEAMAALLAYPWPGNVRELENAIEHAFVSCPGGHFTLAHLPAEVRAPEAIAASASSPPNPLETAEREVLIRALQEAKGNQAAAAQAVGLARNTLWRKLKRYGIDPRTIKER